MAFAVGDFKISVAKFAGLGDQDEFSRHVNSQFAVRIYLFSRKQQ